MAFIRQFRLSPPGKGRGVSFDVNGAFVGPIPLLKRRLVNGKETWEPRDSSELSDALVEHYGLPIDVSSKAPALACIARALNEGAIARAQLGTLHLQLPEPPPSARSGSRSELIKFIRELASSGLLKANWDPAKHPRWSAGTPDSRGGKFAPKGTSAEPGIGHNGGPPLEPEEAPAASSELVAALGPVAALASAILLATTVPVGSGEDAALEQIHMHHPWPKYLGGAEDQELTPLPKLLHIKYHQGLQSEVAPHRSGRDYYDSLSAQSRAELFRNVARYTKQFDADHETPLFDDMIRNGFPVTE